jgi:acetyl esterase/lipase
MAKVVGIILVVVSFLLNIFLPLSVRPPGGALLTLPKMLAAAMAPYAGIAALLGLLLVLLCGRKGIPWRKRDQELSQRINIRILTLYALGLAAAVLSVVYMLRLASPQNSMEQTFGIFWQDAKSPELSSGMLERRWKWRMPATSKPNIEQDVFIANIPGSSHRLSANLWLPAEGANRTGLAYLYINMGGWKALDKSITYPIFRHIASQGHTVVDFVTRERPDVDIAGMVGDIKRAVFWLKLEGKQYGIDPEKIVIAGGSAGGNLALLTAFTPAHTELTPADLLHADTSVRAAVGFYAPSDLREYYSIEGRRAENFFDKLGDKFYKHAVSPEKLGVGETTDVMLTQLLGGLPGESPDMYDLASPINHVSPNSPATLLFHGEHDTAAPTVSSRRLYHMLVEAGVPAVYIEMPWNEHAYDIIFPQISPSALLTLYYLDHFLAFVAQSEDFGEEIGGIR